VQLSSLNKSNSTFYIEHLFFEEKPFISKDEKLLLPGRDREIILSKRII
jgi:hypothetical protein